MPELSLSSCVASEVPLQRRPGRSAPCRAVFVSLELLADSGEEAAALAPLGSADADAGPASDLIFLIEQVQHVGSDGDALEYTRSIEVLCQSGVEYPITRQFAAVRHDAVRIIGSKP